MSGQPNQLRWVLAGAIICVVIGLGATAHAVFSPRVIAHYADSPDSVDITRWAERAGPRDALGWWTGPWIQQTSPYYRPLSSIIFWLEYLAFGWSFRGHAIISWLTHGAVCALLYWTGLALFTGGVRQRVVFSCVASALFNVRLGPSGPGWMLAPVTYGVVAWWPGQTDQFCLLLSLPALILFDGWLRGTRPNGLWLGAILWIIALLFKEMAVSLPLLAGCMILYRKGLASARVWRVEEVNGAPRCRPAIGLLWRVVLPGILVTVAFLALRSVFVPSAWGPKARSIGYFVEKVIWYAAERPRGLVISRGPWLVILSLFLAACIYVYARLPRRPSAIWLVLAMVIGGGVLAQVFGGNFAIITIPKELAAIGTVTLLVLGIVALLHARTGPAWPLLGMVAAIHLPILHVQGPHYMYWPAAFWGLLNASLLLYVWQARVGGRMQWSSAQ